MVILSSSEFRNHDDFSSLKDQIDKLTSSSFGYSYVSPTVDPVLQRGGYIGFIEMDGQIVASGFAEDDTYNLQYKHKTILLHTFSTHENYRGRGLCQMIVDEFIKKFGRKCILYLTVRTEKDNVNESAIKCYEKNGFIMLPSVYRDHYDGKNSAMVRMPSLNKSRKTKKPTRRRKKKK